MKWRRQVPKGADVSSGFRRPRCAAHRGPGRESWQVLLSTVGIYGTMLVMLLGAAIWLGFDMVLSREQIIQDRSALAVQQSQFMSQWFGTTVVAADYVLRDVLEKVAADEVSRSVADDAVVNRVSPWLAQKLSTVPEAIGLGLYDADCVYRLVADTTKIGIRSNLSFCATLPVVAENRAYTQYLPAAKSASNVPTIAVTRPRIAADGRFLGGALAAFHLGEFQRWIQSFPLDEHDVLALADSDAMIVAYNPPASACFEKRVISLEDLPNFGRQRSCASLIAVSPLDGRTRVYGVSKVENIPLLCIVGFDLQNSLHEWRRRAWQFGGGFLAMLLLYALALREHLLTLRQWDDMRDLAATDPLTGVANRRQLVLCGEKEMARSRRYQGQISLLMVDIDRFKSINDLWGHATGDRVIQAVADAMVDITRVQDVVGRLGGEEFLLILAETDGEGALANAERLRETIQEMASVTSDDNQIVRFTVSIGVTTSAPDDATFADMLGRADRALYAAKNAGRNKVVAVWPEMRVGTVA